MILVDSTIWIDYFNGRISDYTDFLDRALTNQVVLIGDIILAEVLQGFRSESEFEMARQALGQFPQISVVDPLIAVQSARNFRKLRSVGITVRKTIDCLIATCCIENDLQLLHNDHDFDGFEQLGLKVIHP